MCLFLFGGVSAVFADPPPPTLTSVSIVSNNASTTLAKAGNVVTISFIGSRNLDSNPAVTIGGTAAGVTVASAGSATSWTAYRTVAASDSSGLLSFNIEFSSLAVVGVPVTATTDASAVTVDTVAPTAALSFSATTAHGGEPFIITATLSEPIADSPVLALSLFGANTLATTSFSKTDDTHYSFTHTVGAGNGTTTIALGAATDRAGNLIASAPTSGAEFLVENTPPTITGSAIISGNQLKVSYSEPTTSTTTDYSNLTLFPGGSRSLVSIVASTSQSVTIAFDGAAASAAATGTIAVGSSVRDAVGNSLVASTTVLTDGQAPLAPGTPVLNVGSSLINAARDASGFAVLVPLSQSGAVAGDSMGLLLASASFPSPLVRTLTGTDIIFGSAVFAIEHGQLGSDGAKEISARVTDSVGNIGAAGGTLSLSLDTVSPTLASAKITGGNQITFTYSESVFSTTTDYTNLTLSGGNTRTITSTAGSSTATILLTFSGAAVSTSATGTVAVGSAVTDSAGNTFSATTTALTDGQSPTATLSYSKNPVKAGDPLTITATLSEPISDSPVLALSLFGGNTLATTTLTKIDSTHYSFVHSVGAGNGTTTVALDAATDVAGNIIVSAPTSGADFSVDSVAPTATASFSKNPVKAGDITVISLVTSESIDAATPLLISLGGANTVAATSTARADSTHFSFSYTAGLGDGAAAIALSGGADSAGNTITVAPSSGATLTIDNTAPIITIANPNTLPAHEKTVTAAASDGMLTQSITAGVVCNGTLSFGSYASTTFAAETDNGKKICYRAADTAGNIAFLLSDAIAGIDFTPPAIISLTLTPSSGTMKIGDTVTLSVSTDATGYALHSLAINNVATTSMADAGNGIYYATTTVSSGDTDRTAGVVPVAVVFIDAAGNKNATSTAVAANTLAIDANAPTLVSARTTSTTTIQVSFSEDLNGATVNSTGTDFTVSGFVISSASEVTPGVVRLTLGSAIATSEAPSVSYVSSIKDLAGNTAPVAGPMTPTDGVAPVISETTSVLAVTNDNTPNYTFTASEAGTILYGGDCSSSSAVVTSGQNTLSFATLSDGAHGNCTIVVTDAAGNASNQVSVSAFTVDTIAPTVALSSSATNPTRFSPIPFTATFSEPVTGFESADISVANGTVGSFLVASSTVYTFAVTPAGESAITVGIGAAKASDFGGNGNSVSADFSRTFDSVAPNITIASYTLAKTNQDITVSASTNEGTMNASSHLFTVNGSFDFVATDAAGNAATTTITITNIDKTAPVIVTHTAVTIEATSTLGALGTYTAPNATDAVDGAVVVSCSPLSGLQFALGATEVSCTSQDSAGNTTTTTFALNVVDTTAPLITVPGAQTFEATAILSTPPLVLASTTDSVSTTTVALSYAPTSFSVGTTVVTWTARDGAGNSATATSSVTITDTTAPTLTAPPAITTEAASASTTVSLGSPAVSDLVDASPTVTNNAPASFSVGATQVLWTATDSLSNSTTSPQLITLTDTTPPSIAPHADITAEATASSGAPVAFSVSATDAVDGVSAAACAPASGSTFALGSTTVICTKNDVRGNHATSTAFTVRIVDTTAPTIDAASSLAVEATSSTGAFVSIPPPLSHDTVDGDAPSLCDATTGVFPLGVTTVTCSKSDGAGNAATPKTFTVTVRDTTPPSVIPPSPQTFEATAILSTPTLVLASVTDAVSTTTIALSYAPTSFPVGTTEVLWTARDGAGNSATATSSVTIRDTTAPTIASHETVSAPAESATGALITYTPPSATDLASGAVGVLCSPSSGMRFALGTTTVACSAVDAKQNIATSSFAVVVTREISLATTVSVNVGAPDIVVRSGTVATSTISIPSGVASSRLNLAALLVSGTSTRTANIGGAVLVATETSAGSVSLALPSGMEIRGGSLWDGAFLLPRAASASPTPPVPSSGMTVAVSRIVEVGSEDAELTLSRAARLLLPGAAGQLVGSTRSGAAFTPITVLCVSDTQSSADAQLGSTTPAACKISVGGDLAVWTNHFTSFVAYTETPLPPPSPFRGGNGPIMIAASRAGAGNYGVPVSGGDASIASVPSATAPAPAAPAAVAVLPAAPQPVSPVRIALERGRGANQSGTVSIPALGAPRQANGTAAKSAEPRVAFSATATPNTLAKAKSETVSPTPPLQELAAAAVAAESNSALARIKKGWSAFVQKVRAFRR